MTQKRFVPCVPGAGMCVSLKHGLVIISDDRTQQLHMYSLTDGSLVRSVGSCGRGKGQFRLLSGGLCVSPDGDDVLVEECWDNRIQQVRIADGSWVRFIGEGVVTNIQPVDCNADVVVVSTSGGKSIHVFSWVDGSLRTRFDVLGTITTLLFDIGRIRLLADGSGIVAADVETDVLRVFTMSGEFVKTVANSEQSLFLACDMVQCVADGSFIVASYNGNNLVKMGWDGSHLGVYGEGLKHPTALATLPDGGLVVRDEAGIRLFHGLDLRETWVTACVAGALECTM